MALVRGVEGEEGPEDPYYTVQGIVTLEDVLEFILGMPSLPPSLPAHPPLIFPPSRHTHVFTHISLPSSLPPSLPPSLPLGDEIQDETDRLQGGGGEGGREGGSTDPTSFDHDPLGGLFYDPPLNSGGREGGGGETFMRFQRAVSDFGRLKLLDMTRRDERLGEGELESVGMYLLTQVSPFKEVVEERGMEEAQRTMRRVLEASPVLVLGGREEGKEGKDGEEGNVAMVYKKGSVYTAMTVVLQGAFKVTAGRDGFQCECGPYSTLAAEAIQVGKEGGSEGGRGVCAEGDGGQGWVSMGVWPLRDVGGGGDSGREGREGGREGGTLCESLDISSHFKQYPYTIFSPSPRSLAPSLPPSLLGGLRAIYPRFYGHGAQVQRGARAVRADQPWGV